MRLVDEQHTVSLVSIDGLTRVIATGRLNEDDQGLDTLKDEVVREFGNDNEAVIAFDAAFEQCEAKPGGAVIAEATFERGTIVVERRLAA